MNASLRQLIKGTGGTTAVEFAFASVALIAFIFGIIEFGRMLWTQQVLQTVAAETARCVAIASPDCPVAAAYAVSVAAKRGLSTVTTNEIAVSGAPPAGDTCGVAGGVFTKVTVTYPFITVVPAYIPQPTGGLSAHACFPHA
jgi:Flp pilus assembly protein TadG